MKKLRQIHLYLGVLFAPSILFFAFTGAYQTFRWNETGALGALTPIASQMASIHKNAALESGEKRRKKRPESAARPEAQERAESRENAPAAARRPSPLPLKIYVFLMSLGLIASTVTGVLMALKYPREKRVVWSLLIAGTLLPLGLLFV